MHSLLPALVSGLFLGYGLYVLSSRGFNRISLSFLALCVATFGWQAIWAALFQTTDPHLADRLIRAGYLVIIFLPTCLYHFVVAVLGVRGERRWLQASYAVASVLAALNLCTDLFVAGHYRYFFGFYPQAGPLHGVHVVQAGAVVGRGIWLCHRTARIVTGERSRRTRLLGVALLIYLLAAVDYLCNYGVAMYPPGVGFITVSLGIIAYAASRHGLMNSAEMAASVAHEIRTPLACTPLAQLVEPAGLEVRGFAEAVVDAEAIREIVVGGGIGRTVGGQLQAGALPAGTAEELHAVVELHAGAQEHAEVGAQLGLDAGGRAIERQLITAQGQAQVGFDGQVGVDPATQGGAQHAGGGLETEVGGFDGDA